MKEFQRIQITSRAELRAWLVSHFQQQESIWLVTFKKASQTPSVPYDDIVEEALCFGWVDSLPRKLDEERSMLLLSPRKRGSSWSAVNKRRVEKLVALGLMTEAGLRKIHDAQEDGSWSFLDDVETLELPEDLRHALECVAGAANNFAAFSKSSRRGILEWIKNAKQSATRAKRLQETARLAGLNIKANHPEAKGK